MHESQNSVCVCVRARVLTQVQVHLCVFRSLQENVFKEQIEVKVLISLVAQTNNLQR